jgi:hypothetical protein
MTLKISQICRVPNQKLRSQPRIVEILVTGTRSGEHLNQRILHQGDYCFLLNSPSSLKMINPVRISWTIIYANITILILPVNLKMNLGLALCRFHKFEKCLKTTSLRKPKLIVNH